MFGLDDWIASAGHGHPLLLATVLAAVLGLRHATDPDHLSAVTTLVAAANDRRRAQAMRLGLAWGAGHATTLFLFGLPIVLASRYLPAVVQEVAEASVGVVIVVLGARLLLRWHRGAFHLHEHDHAGATHIHLHGHGDGDAHAHRHAPRTRTPLGAYAIGLVHGLGGSAGVGVLLLASIPDKALAVAALALFAGCTALSMAVCTGAFGAALSTRRAQRRFGALAPALGILGVAFGAWYFAGALSLVAYPL